ncbi:MAG: SseB family protein [Pseudomonadota bacterium]
MESYEFEPRNDIERLLAEMLSGQVEPEAFAHRLMDMQVFMPVRDEKHQIAGFQRSTQAEPLVLEDDEGNRALIVFSGPDRAKDFLADFPDYSGGLLTEFSWLLRRMSADLSIALNPGMDAGFDFDPGMVAMLAALLPAEDA